MGSQLIRILAAALVLGGVLVGCSQNQEDLDKAAVAPKTGNANDRPPEGNKPVKSADQKAGTTPAPEPMPPGANRDHP